VEIFLNAHSLTRKRGKAVKLRVKVAFSVYPVVTRKLWISIP